MTLMNVMDSVFYLGLVVTFLLILLVVYHFKNRVSTMEQRCDTMFEIMNNIVQELNLLRRHQQVSIGGGGPPTNTPTNVEQVYHETDTREQELTYPENEYASSDESSYSSDEDLEEESDDEEEDRVVELVNEDNAEQLHDTESLKHVQMNSETLEGESAQASLLEMDDSSIKIEKIETTLENIDTDENTVSSLMDTYKNMTNSALKALVIEKGLNTNPSKLKKSDLLELLTELE
jgi:hypothetical protein